MGRIFIQHMGGNRLFSCASCETVLTNRDELISTRYTYAYRHPSFVSRLTLPSHSRSLITWCWKVHWSYRASIPLQQGGQPQVQRSAGQGDADRQAYGQVRATAEESLSNYKLKSSGMCIAKTVIPNLDGCMSLLQRTIKGTGLIYLCTCFDVSIHGNLYVKEW